MQRDVGFFTISNWILFLKTLLSWFLDQLFSIFPFLFFIAMDPIFRTCPFPFGFKLCLEVLLFILFRMFLFLFLFSDFTWGMVLTLLELTHLAFLLLQTLFLWSFDQPFSDFFSFFLSFLLKAMGPIYRTYTFFWGRVLALLELTCFTLPPFNS